MSNDVERAFDRADNAIWINRWVAVPVAVVLLLTGAVLWYVTRAAGWMSVCGFTSVAVSAASIMQLRLAVRHMQATVSAEYQDVA